MFSPFGFNPYYSPYNYPGVWRDPLEDLIDEDLLGDVDTSTSAQQLPSSALQQLPRQPRRRHRRSKHSQQQEAGGSICAECGNSGGGRQQLAANRVPLQRDKELQQQLQPQQQAGGTLSALAALPQAFQRPLDVQVSDEDNRLVLRANLAGVARDKIKLSFDENNNTLNLHAVRHHSQRDDQSSLNFTETIRRSISLPAGITESQIEAHLQNDQLEVVVPKPQQQQEQQPLLGGRNIAIGQGREKHTASALSAEQQQKQGVAETAGAATACGAQQQQTMGA